MHRLTGTYVRCQALRGPGPKSNTTGGRGRRGRWTFADLAERVEGQRLPVSGALFRAEVEKEHELPSGADPKLSCCSVKRSCKHPGP